MLKESTGLARAFFLVVGLAAAAASQAHITRIEIERVESPTFDGTTFGKVGQYEKLRGRAYGELDPAHEGNKGVVLLDKAPRNAAGRIEYSVDILILKPVDMRLGNRTLIYDVVNRGNLRAIEVFNHNGPGTNDPTSAKDAGERKEKGIFRFRPCDPGDSAVHAYATRLTL